MRVKQSISPAMFVSICLCLSAWSGSVAAATYYVTKTGNNKNSCALAQNQRTSKTTINAGLACLKAGDTLTIGAGTYTESLTRPPSNVTIKAMTPKGVTLNPSGTLRVVDIWDNSHNITLDGLVLDGSKVTNTPVKIRENSSHITLRNGVVKNTKVGAACIQVVQGTSDIVLSNLEIYNCQSASTANPGIHGIYWAASDSLIENCRFHGFSGYAIQFYNSGGSPINGNTFHGNIIYDSHIRGAIYIGPSAKDNLVSKNTVYDVNDGIQVRGSHNKIVSNKVDSKVRAISLFGAYNIITGNTVSSNIGSPMVNGGKGNSISNNNY